MNVDPKLQNLNHPAARPKNSLILNLNPLDFAPKTAND